MELLVDMALLASTSALVHYAFGMQGMSLALLIMTAVEHGRTLFAAFTQHCGKIGSFVIALCGTSVSPITRRPPLSRQDTWRVDGVHKASDHEEGGMEEDFINGLFDERDEEEEEDRDTFQENMAPVLDEDPAPSAVREELSRLIVRDVGSSAFTAPSSSETTASSSSGRSQPRMQMNSRSPIPFENELFVGHVYFLVRTSPEDPHWSDLFVGKRRMFWIQVQGRFKCPPRGVVYLGGELPSRISLGIFTKSLALVIMGIIQKLVGKVYVCFGDNPSARRSDVVDEALPCVSFPLYQSVDQFMETPEGETPPPLGKSDFGESDEARRRRRQTPLGTERFEVGPTYSFHFHTMYVDLTHWKTANLPGMTDMNLTTFFDSLPLRLMAYDIPATPQDTHRQRDKQYLFCFNIEFDPNASTRSGLWRSDSEYSLESSVSSNGTGGTYDSSPGVTVTQDELAVAVPSGSAVRDVVTKVDWTNARALSQVSLQYLYWMEEVDNVTTAVRRVQYIFRLQSQDTADQLVVVSAYKLRLLLGGTYRKLAHLYPLQHLRFHARSRIGSYSVIDDEALHVTAEIQRLLARSRRVYKELCAADGEETDGVSSSGDSVDPRELSFDSELYQCLTARQYLEVAPEEENSSEATAITPSRVGVNLSKRDREDQQVAFEGVVYRFYASTVLRQEVLVATATELHFYRSFSSRPEKIVPNDRVIGVQAMFMPYTAAPKSTNPDTQSNTFGFAFRINTFAEEIVVCVATEHTRNTWIRVILQHCCPHSNFDRVLTAPLAVCYTPTKALQPADRVVLNSRQLFPRRDPPAQQTPLLIVASTLRLALSIHQHGEHAEVMTILEFLNQASALRSIDLEALHERSHEEQLAFYLNLYHALLAHAMIAHGYPRSKAQWAYFQTHLCYAVGYENSSPTQPLTMSLAEIEHVILRARLPRADLPHLDVTRCLNTLPAARLRRWAIAHPDFRVSFALLMNQVVSDVVPVFDNPERIHEVLNAVLQAYLALHIRVDLDRKTIYLPRICEWYREDFGGQGSPLYCVRKLLGFMPEATQDDVQAVLSSPVLIHIKYRSFPYMPKTGLRFSSSFSAMTATHAVEEDAEESQDEQSAEE
ncbi:hypothetical protein Poli38472_009022 [Pythium oligandrum]|uniref:DUF547 domain-containing protein n=1 Tax=Pythium oligandrum TaxID=41045 RepID=A0A8K1CKC8_PYTOL|nr:hypothetical protein Poli38472_009022 [Pythium oligandrum]|eukprot:TMW64855.1 hypothetical protein Poli38472_009022 [Pythium oligandrum]